MSCKQVPKEWTLGKKAAEKSFVSVTIPDFIIVLYSFIFLHFYLSSMIFESVHLDRGYFFLKV